MGTAPKYHWNVDSKGKLYGLVSMHLITKDLPNWFWATFEHVDNVGRCDYIGCHDEFGVSPANVAPNASATCQAYAPGTLTPAVTSLLTSAGLGPEWQNYRLKGIQLDFTDSTGRPTLLGNSVTEDGFAMTSSCITCHSRATTNGVANGFLSVFSPATPSPAQKACLSGDGPLVSFNGTPDPSWFYTGAQPQYLQMDFVWAFFNASAAP